MSVDAEATTSVDQGNYFATGALAPTADGNLFFGSDMDLDDDEEVVADDHDVRIQAAIEEMQADRAVSPFVIPHSFCCLLINGIGCPSSPHSHCSS